MIVTPIKTNKILPFKYELFEILDHYVTNMKEKSILAITSKIVSLCEGRVVKIGTVDKQALIKKESELYLPYENPYHITLTIKQGILIPTAGIDESNGYGYYILWPKDAQKTANEVKEYLQKRFALTHVGVIIVDSKTTPLRWGTTGIAIAHSGFAALNDYIGKPDIFGRKLNVTKANIMDSLGATAVAVMGEGNEQTPLTTIEDAAFVRFTRKNPTEEEIDALKIERKDDLYAPLLTCPQWKKGEDA
ncbi:coenzyme F420-0:L-glutamate ligase [Candidatus Roizmanbacteria bacterium]|nr:coenzyme F420-0:L-glutamate ligase [Candidatus Roizmanbacteria bacterium]